MPQRISGILNIPQGCSDHHDRQSNPEEYKEASEVSIFAPWVEVGDSSRIFDGRKHPVFLLSSDLLPRRRYRLGRRRGIGGKWCRAPTGRC
jgi:hypothetical protein